MHLSTLQSECDAAIACFRLVVYAVCQIQDGLLVKHGCNCTKKVACEVSLIPSLLVLQVLRQTHNHELRKAPVHTYTICQDVSRLFTSVSACSSTLVRRLLLRWAICSCLDLLYWCAQKLSALNVYISTSHLYTQQVNGNEPEGDTECAGDTDGTVTATIC